MSESMQNIPEEILILLMQQWEGSLPASDKAVLEDYLLKNPAVREYWQSQSFLRNELSGLSRLLKPQQLSDIKKAQLLQLSNGKKSEWKYWLFYAAAASLFFSIVAGFYYEAYKKSSEMSVYAEISSLNESTKEKNEESLTKDAEDKLVIDVVKDKSDSFDQSKKQIETNSGNVPSKPRSPTNEVLDKRRELTLAEEADIPKSLEKMVELKSLNHNQANSLKPEKQKEAFEKEKELLGKKDVAGGRAGEVAVDKVTTPIALPERGRLQDVEGAEPSLFKSMSLGTVVLQKFSTREWGFDKFRELSGLPSNEKNSDKLVGEKDSLLIVDGAEEKISLAKNEEQITKTAKAVTSKKGKRPLPEDKKSYDEIAPKEEVVGESIDKKEDIAVVLDQVYSQLLLLQSYQGQADQKSNKEKLLNDLKENVLFKSDPAFQKYLEQYK